MFVLEIFEIRAYSFLKSPASMLEPLQGPLFDKEAEDERYYTVRCRLTATLLTNDITAGMSDDGKMNTRSELLSSKKSDIDEQVSMKQSEIWRLGDCFVFFFALKIFWSTPCWLFPAFYTTWFDIVQHFPSLKLDSVEKLLFIPVRCLSSTKFVSNSGKWIPWHLFRLIELAND